MLISARKWRWNQPPPSKYFSKTQTTSLLSASLFPLDNLLQNPLSKHKGFCRRLSNREGDFCEKSSLLPGFEKISKIFFLFAGKWYSPRAPPLFRCPSHPPQNIETGGITMFDTKSDYALNKKDKDAIV